MFRVLTLFSLVTLFAGGSALAGDVNERRTSEEIAERLETHLELKQPVARRVAAALVEARDRGDIIREQYKSHAKALRSAVESEDEALAAEQLAELDALREQGQALREEVKETLKAELSIIQLAKLRLALTVRRLKRLRGVE